MSLFDSWHRRHLADGPKDPASPPFAMGDRVTVSSTFEDGAFINGTHGEVIGVDFITDPNDPYGPWRISVLLDGSGLKMAFHAAELTREPKPAETPEPAEEDFAAVGEVPEIPFREDVPATPIYDQVREQALAVDGFAAEVEADLKALTERNAR